MTKEQSNILKNSICLRIREGMDDQDIAESLGCSLLLVQEVHDTVSESYTIGVTLSEAKRIRGMTRRGMNVADIVGATGRSESDVRRILRGRKVPTKKKPQKNRSGHQILQKWGGKPAPVPTGKCVAWVVVEGKAKQCGAKCKGQRCKDHPITIARTIYIRAKTSGGLAA